MEKHTVTRTIGRRRQGERLGEEGLSLRYRPAVIHIIDALAGRITLSPAFALLIASSLDEAALRRLATALSDRCALAIDTDVDESELTGEIARAVRNDVLEGNAGAGFVQLCESVLLDAFYDAHADSSMEDPIACRALELCGVLGISEAEAQFLALLHLGNRIPAVGELLHDRPLEEFMAVAGTVLEVETEEMIRMLSPSGNLISLKLVGPDFLPPPHFSLTNRVKSFLDLESGGMSSDSFALKLEGRTLPLDSFPVEKELIGMTGQILSGAAAARVLLHGQPGTGKSELARSLAAASGKEAYVLLSDPKDNDDDSVSRRLALTVMARKCARGGAILIVDEADNLLNSEDIFRSTTDKGWLVEFLDTCGATMIWITNSIEHLHPAVARRFTYNIGFSHFSDTQRRQVWNTLVREGNLTGLVSEETIKTLSREFPVDAGGIALAVKTAASLAGDGEDLQPLLRGILNRHGKLTGADRRENSLKPLNASYDPSLVNSDTSTADLEALLLGYGEREQSLPLNLLFWGPPGTGKTEFAKYLAEKTGRTLMVRRASDLLSKYPGETEERIAAAFAEAQAGGSIFLLDEADSFFLDRATSRNSWERTQTNELLTCMENYRGVLICCTNNLDLLDHAVLRRFGRKVHFRPLTPAAKVTMFERFFCTAGETLNREQRERIGALAELTPGDLFAIESTLAFRPGGAPPVEGIIAELEAECGYRNAGREKRVAGFTA